MKNIAKPCTPAWRLPWNVAHSDDKGRARFNIIAHLLGSIDSPYRLVPEEC
jgi:polyphosphate kinase 2 (PPK2 family)